MTASPDAVADRPARRSWLVVPVPGPDEWASLDTTAADVVVLDLVEFVQPRYRGDSRLELPTAIARLAGNGHQVFVQTTAADPFDDLDAAVRAGLTGIVVADAETRGQIEAIDGLLDRQERERGLSPGAIEIVVALESGRGNWDAFEIATASSRVTGVTLGRVDLKMDLRAEPSGELHLLPYLMERLIVVAGACGRSPIGAWWRHPARGMLADEQRTYEAAVRGAAIGFRGGMCLTEEQVRSFNRAYAPASDRASR
ncbi:aldolase/citrate lyase family protein [Blastococcus sp. URHD0036]|uniref:aldolase/citrate lyase family protein n=1 Tax=Blastococcus sp. URHD0036 TaxID=1380356 RepID=UPI000497C1AC|nr:aldolase/citrate lyase family protein [Blastococcus sp. URHD0036]